jgi:hypothetical protein
MSERAHRASYLNPSKAISWKSNLVRHDTTSRSETSESPLRLAVGVADFHVAGQSNESQLEREDM